MANIISNARCVQNYRNIFSKEIVLYSCTVRKSRSTSLFAAKVIQSLNVQLRLSFLQIKYPPIHLPLQPLLLQPQPLRPRWLQPP
jgi:hypothetical protein